MRKILYIATVTWGGMCSAKTARSAASSPSAPRPARQDCPVIGLAHGFPTKGRLIGP